MVVADHPQQRTLVVAAGLLPERAARVEPASGRRVRRRRQVARDQDPLAAVLDQRVRDRHRRHQRLRVRVQRLAVEVVRGRLLDDRAEVHHADHVADVPHHREVVRDHHVGQPERVLQLLEQVDHLGLDRHVERRHRLVGDDQLRVERDRPGDADALALAAGELVRVAADRARRQADDRRAARGPVAACAAAAALGPVRDQRLGQDRLDVLPRVQARHRVLEDHLHPAAGPAQLLALERGHVDAVEEHAARGRVDQPEDALARACSCRSRSRRPGRTSCRARPRGRRRRPPSRGRPRGRRAMPRRIGKCTSSPRTSSSGAVMRSPPTGCGRHVERVEAAQRRGRPAPAAARAPASTCGSRPARSGSAARTRSRGSRAACRSASRGSA